MSSTDSQKLLMVVMNGGAAIKYTRGQTVPEHQRQYIDNMDKRMDVGIDLSGEFINNPNVLQRTQFVASLMINALSEDNDTLASAMCTYIAERMPDLDQVKAAYKEESGLSIELVFDRSYAKSQQEQVITFNA